MHRSSLSAQLFTEFCRVATRWKLGVAFISVELDASIPLGQRAAPVGRVDD